MTFTQDGPMDTVQWIENTGEPRARKRASAVRRRAGGKGLCKQYLACCLSYFCVFCETQEDAQAVIDILTDWLSKRGLALSPEKTKIVHLTEGFNFLGFHIRLYRVSNSTTGWKLLTK